MFQALGGGHQIGGSHYRYDEILIDCGADQSESGKRIKYPPLHQGGCKAIILSHDHLDHCGGMARLAREYPDVPFFMTELAKLGLELQLRDSLKLAKFFAEVDLLKGLAPEPEFFSKEDLESLLKRITVVRDTGWFSPIPGYQMSFSPAGHKPGAAIILIKFPDGIRWIHAVDFCRQDLATVKGVEIPEDFRNPDGMTIECTYGALDRRLPDRTTEEARLIEAVRKVFRRGGKGIIPHFASSSAQVAIPLARALYEEFGVCVYVDGMARDFLEDYEATSGWSGNEIPFRLEDLPGLAIVDGGDAPGADMAYRRMLLESKEPFVVVSSSGMLEGGPSVWWVEQLIEGPNNTVVIPGYQAEGTKGRKLLELQKGRNFTVEHQFVVDDGYGRRRLREFTNTYQILADVEAFKLSGHSDGYTVAPWVCAINPKKVITVHGDYPEAHYGMAVLIGRINKNIQVVSARNGDKISLRGD